APAAGTRSEDSRELEARERAAREARERELREAREREARERELREAREARERELREARERELRAEEPLQLTRQRTGTTGQYATVRAEEHAESTSEICYVEEEISDDVERALDDMGDDLVIPARQSNPAIPVQAARQQS